MWVFSVIGLCSALILDLGDGCKNTWNTDCDEGHDDHDTGLDERHSDQDIDWIESVKEKLEK